MWNLNFLTHCQLSTIFVFFLFCFPLDWDGWVRSIYLHNFNQVLVQHFLHCNCIEWMHYHGEIKVPSCDQCNISIDIPLKIWSKKNITKCRNHHSSHHRLLERIQQIIRIWICAWKGNRSNKIFPYF